MEEVDARGNALTEKAVRLEGRVMNIAQVYNTTVRRVAPRLVSRRMPSKFFRVMLRSNTLARR